MHHAKMLVTRRRLVAAGGMGAFALAALTAGPVMAEDAFRTTSGTIPPVSPPNAKEKANIQLVKDFCQAWGEDSPDVDKLTGQFLSDDCVVRFGDTIPPVTGQESIVALFQTFLNNGERYDLKILETFARGPVVVTSRTDSTLKGKRTTNATSVVGVFVIKDGKIKEWSEYV
jgi:limonene-1,2-epoxide hydrolase